MKRSPDPRNTQTPANERRPVKLVHPSDCRSTAPNSPCAGQRPTECVGGRGLIRIVHDSPRNQPSAQPSSRPAMLK